TLIQYNYYKHIVQNSKDIGVEGYRIRIFSDIGHGAKERQQRIRAKFLSLYPEIQTYPPYEGSYYKIYVGDFRTKRDALKVLEIIIKDFPDAFIVEDKIVIEE
ncbi:MAG: SPOR domain-containing protein, partial [Bacteroidales bacterium]|nr:SPOR domain-containing protein [Bacteroidales bacterium]